MFPIKTALPTLMFLASGMAITAVAIAQTNSGVSASVPPPAATQTAPLVGVAPPRVNVKASAADQFERNPILSLPGVFVRQNTPGLGVAPESLISEQYIHTVHRTARTIGLKETIYIAIRNNPGLAVTQLDPIGATEAVKQANATFDPDLTAQLDTSKQVSPVSSTFQVRGSDAFTQKFYDWNFGVNKILATTNGTLGLTFDNNRSRTNSTFASVNPSY